MRYSVSILAMPNLLKFSSKYTYWQKITSYLVDPKMWSIKAKIRRAPPKRERLHEMNFTDQGIESYLDIWKINEVRGHPKTMLTKMLPYFDHPPTYYWQLANYLLTYCKPWHLKTSPSPSVYLILLCLLSRAFLFSK